MSHFNIFHMVKPLMVVPFHVYPMVNQSPIHMVNQKTHVPTIWGSCSIIKLYIGDGSLLTLLH